MPVGQVVEFGFTSAYFITVDFTGTQMLVTLRIDADTSGCPSCRFNSVWMQFYDNAFTKLTKVSDTFSLGGMNGSYDGNGTIFLMWVAEMEGPGHQLHPGDYFTATFDVAPGTVPEPSSLLMLGSGLLALAGVVRRKARF